MTPLEEVTERRQQLQREYSDCWRCQLKFILSDDDWERFSLCGACRRWIEGRREVVEVTL